MDRYIMDCDYGHDSDSDTNYFYGFFLWKDGEEDYTLKVSSEDLGLDTYETEEELFSKIDKYLTEKLGFEPEYAVIRN
jgi:hypothetical protein